MVGMVVGDDQIIDLLHPRRLGRRRDALGIALIVAAPPRIHHHRLARRGYDQRRLSPFHVNRVDFQIPGRRQNRRRHCQENARTQRSHT